jgi:hypothetical protein
MKGNEMNTTLNHKTFQVSQAVTECLIASGPDSYPVEDVNGIFEIVREETPGYNSPFPNIIPMMAMHPQIDFTFRGSGRGTNAITHVVVKDETTSTIAGMTTKDLANQIKALASELAWRYTLTQIG